MRYTLWNFTENMQFIQVNTVLSLVLLLLHSIKADLRHCADFDPEEYDDESPYQNELEQLLGSLNETNSEKTEEIFQLLQRIGTDEINRINYMSSSKLGKYVVSL